MKVKAKVIFFVVVFLILAVAFIFRFDMNPPVEEKPVLDVVNASSDVGSADEDADEYTVLRKQMVETQLKTRDITDERVLAAMGRVPRHKLMPYYWDQAYEDHPVPIGYGQTISQPYIVALMTQSLGVNSSYRVLEVGTGSGYQAAVLAELVDVVYSIEIIGALVERANNRLGGLGYDNVHVKHADGYFGWSANAPFDAIIVTAAANHVPPPLIEQLDDGGRLVIPLANTMGFQTLTLITKKDGELETEFITGVRFVPMTGKAQERG